MYMQGFKCTVTGAKATHALAPAVPAVYCKDDPSRCVKGAKQMIVFNQAEGDNVPVPREARSPGYNAEVGFLPGAQKDIFVGGAEAAPAPSTTAPAPAPSSTEAAPVAASSSKVVNAVPASASMSAAPSLVLPDSPPKGHIFSRSTFSTRVRPAATLATSSSIIPQVRPSPTKAAPVRPGKSCQGKRK
jgi:hypothetical protein